MADTVIILGGVARLKIDGVTWSGSFFATSDKKFKKNIKPIQSGLTISEKIDGKTYSWNTEAFKDSNFDASGHSGYIAHVLEKVVLYLVATDENGEKAVNYFELIPYLVEAIKEQQNQIVALNNRIQDLILKEVLSENKITVDKTYFSGTYPKPFESFTKIDYYIDKNVNEAKILVYDMNGSTIYNYNLGERGLQASLSINKDNLTSGIYFYTLITDGVIIGTKNMIVN